MNVSAHAGAAINVMLKIAKIAAFIAAPPVVKRDIYLLENPIINKVTIELNFLSFRIGTDIAFSSPIGHSSPDNASLASFVKPEGEKRNRRCIAYGAVFTCCSIATV